MASSTANLSAGRRWGLATALSVWSALGVVAAVVLWRRLAGAFADELPAPAACLIVLSTLALSVLAYAGWLALSPLHEAEPEPPPRGSRIIVRLPLDKAHRQQWTTAAATALPPLALCAALIPPASAFRAFCLAAVFVAACVAMFVITKAATPGADTSPSRWLRIWEPRLHPAQNRRSGPRDAPLPTAGLDAGSRPLQQLSRYSLSAGGEQVDGVLQAVFAAGQSQTAIHLPFSPPLCSTPIVTCRVLDESVVRARVTAAKSYGARIELKRTGDVSQPAYVAVSTEATAVPQSRTT